MLYYAKANLELYLGNEYKKGFSKGTPFRVDTVCEGIITLITAYDIKFDVSAKLFAQLFIPAYKSEPQHV